MGLHRSERHIEVGEGDGCLCGRFFAMASPCEVLCETDDFGETRELTELAAQEVWRIEDKFSRYLSGNVVDRINSADGAAVDVDAETAQLIDFAETLFDLSDGRFDITSGVLRRVWDFDGGDNVPSEAAVGEVMQLVGWQRAMWSRQTLRLMPGMEVDLGGVGKEYAVDRAAGLLRDATGIACLVNLGGDLVALRNPISKSAWKVGVESPDSHSENPARLINLEVGGLATSGDARRFLLKDGVRYSHILDPTTGWPVPDAPRSVTVAADTCTQAGMLSTLSMLQGAQAETFLDAQGVRYWCDRSS